MCLPNGESWDNAKRGRWFVRTELRKVRSAGKEIVHWNRYREQLDIYSQELQDVRVTEFRQLHWQKAIEEINDRKAAEPDQLQNRVPPTFAKRNNIPTVAADQ
eukprot:gb/GEZJ01006038.1/.p2 GENE.gb/GEZJ01006038.1/~~gb/GEZJ01006038.1/.p2  ORF type:complete len:103 (-),score=9.80 gb/GEZJ01006038.1/:2908-3216(-)